MRINIQETVEAHIPAREVTRLQESASGSSKTPDKIVTVVEAIHSGLTRNYTFYPGSNLERSVESWTKPYNKPVIKNHDIHEEPLGRVLSARFKPSDIAPGKECIELELEITDPDTIKKVLDGRYQTMSIGGSTESAVCSVCSKDLVKEGYCGHMKGRTYEGKQAYWVIGEMSFDEVSWVNAPADPNAQVVTRNAAVQKESTSTEGGNQMSNPVAEQQTEDILAQIDKLRESSSTPTPVVEQNQDPAQQTEGEKPEGQTEGEGEKPAEKTLEEQLKEANEKVVALEAEVESLKSEKLTLETEVEGLKKQVEDLQAELSAANEENKNQVKQNMTIATYSHRVLAENVANLHVVLGKCEESAREELVRSLVKENTSRSLQEQSLALLAEKPQRVVQHIENPTLPITDNDNASGGEQTSAPVKEEKEVTILDLAEAMSKVFSKKNQ